MPLPPLAASVTVTVPVTAVVPAAGLVIAGGRQRAVLGVHRDGARRGVPGERRAGLGGRRVVGEDVARAVDDLHLGLDVRVGVGRQRRRRVVAEQRRLEAGDLADDGLEVVHVIRPRLAPVAAHVAEGVVAEAPPEEALGALDDGHVGVVTHLLARGPAAERGELEELQDRQVRPRVLYHVAIVGGPVGHHLVVVAAARLGAVHRVRIRRREVDGVTPHREIRIAQLGHERHAVRVEATQPIVLGEGARNHARDALVHRVVAGAGRVGADGLHVVVRGVDAEAGVGGEPVEAVAGLQVHDAVLLEVVHQRLHRFGGGAAVPVVQVHVDLQAVHAPLTRRRPQQVLPEGGIGAVAGGGVVDAEDEARRAVHQHAVLVVVGRHAGHAIGWVRVRRGVARQVHQ